MSDPEYIPPCPDCGYPRCICDPFAIENAKFQREHACTDETQRSGQELDRANDDRRCGG